MSAKPLTVEQNVGYVIAEDVYIVYSEYYGDGTIYGRQAMIFPDGSLASGSGKSKNDLVAIGALVSDDVNGALSGDLIVVPVDAPAVIPESAPSTVPAPVEEQKPIESATSLKTLVVNMHGIKVVFNTQLTAASSVIVNVDEVNGTVEFTL